LNHRTIDPNQNPFFDQVFHTQHHSMQKGGAIGLMANSTPVNKVNYQQHQPTMGGLQNTQPGGFHNQLPQTGNPLY
jgi:hypothetical protein